MFFTLCLFLLSLAHLCVCSTITLHPVAIPLDPSQPDVENANRGYYKWLEQTIIPAPSYDNYNRYHWAILEPTENNYDFSAITADLADAQKRQGRFGFRVIALDSYTGGVAVPSYVQATQQAAGRGFYYYPGGSATTNTPAQDPSICWAPDWNDAFFLTRVQALVSALASSFANNGRLWFVDVGIYGDFGEWHVYNVPYPGPHGETDMTDANKNYIVDLISDNFPNQYWVFQMFASYNNATGYHAYNKSPKFGIRNDCFSSPQFDVMPQGQIWRQLVNRWQTAPIIAEFCTMHYGGEITLTSGDPSYGLRQVSQYHVTMISSGNIDYFENWPAAQQQQLLQIGQLSGYRIVIDTLTVASSVQAGKCLSITTIWNNVNPGAIYEDWNVIFQLRNASYNYAESQTKAVVIYDDALATNWANWPARGTVDLSNTDVTPFKGIYCGKLTPTDAWSVVALHYLPTSPLYDLSPYTHLHLAVRSGQAASTLGVRLDGAGESWIPLSDWGSAPVSSKWTEYLIPLSAFNAVNAKIVNVLLQDTTGSATNIYYFDDVEFRTYSTPDPTKAILWSGTSVANMRKVLPTSVHGKYQVSDHFLIPTTTKLGTYDLHVQITNPYYPNMALAINGQISDGSYKLTSGISVTVGTTTSTCSAGSAKYVQPPVLPLHPPLYFYSDSVNPIFACWTSNGAALDLASTAVTPYKGTDCIKYTTTWAACIGFETASGLNTAGYTHLHFAVRSNSASAALNIWVNENVRLSLASYGGNPPTTAWRSYMIPLSALQATNIWVTDLYFQDSNMAANIVYYFDDLALVNSAYVVYDDQLASGWDQEGARSTVSLSSTSPAPYSGNYAIKFTGTSAWGNTDLVNAAGFNVNGYTHLNFAIRSAQATTEIWVACWAGEWTSSTVQLPLDNYGGQPTSTGWKHYSVPLADLSASGVINHVMFADATTQTGLSYYYDEVQFV